MLVKEGKEGLYIGKAFSKLLFKENICHEKQLLEQVTDSNASIPCSVRT